MVLVSSVTAASSCSSGSIVALRVMDRLIGGWSSARQLQPPEIGGRTGGEDLHRVHAQRLAIRQIGFELQVDGLRRRHRLEIRRAGRIDLGNRPVGREGKHGNVEDVGIGAWGCGW